MKSSQAMPATRPDSRPDTSGEEALTTAQAATRLGVAPNTVMNWVDAGLLRAWRTPGGHRRIDAESVRLMLSQREQQLSSFASRALRVLIVEDHPDTARLLCSQVQDILPAARVTLRADGFQALIEAGRDVPDLIVTDINLPGMNGLAMLKSLRAAPGTEAIRFVLVSNHRAGEIAGFGELPADVPLLAKPVQTELLREALARVLRPHEWR